jgi:hypothetical protein
MRLGLKPGVVRVSSKVVRFIEKTESVQLTVSTVKY